MNYRKSPLQAEKHRFIQQLRQAPTSVPSSVATAPFPREAMADLEENVAGRIVWPWSPGYDQAKQEFDDVYPAHPQVIIYAICYADVKSCLQFAHIYKLQTAIRSGGHSFGGYSVCDGMVIDVSNLNSIYVNVSTQTALIETGCNFEKINPVLESYGMHMPGGGCATVCIGGYMQGGGYGLTSRMYGMNCDNVLECTVMLADGGIVVANDKQNEDLYWAIRGGTGGNFGVLLSAMYRIHPLGNIFGMQAKWPIEDDIDAAADVLYAIQEMYLQPNAYPNLGIETIFTSDSTDNNRKKIFFCTTWIGDEENFAEVLQPLLHIGLPECSLVQVGKYSTVNAFLLEKLPDIPDNVAVEAFSRSAIIGRSLTQSDWKSILNYFLTAPNQYTMVDIECYGGRINQVPVGTNAFIHRSAKLDFFCLSLFDVTTNQRQQCEDWLEAYYRVMAPYSNGHSYQNYPDRNQTDFRWAYWGNYYNQLVAIKNKYDPANFFHYQQSIGSEMLDDTNQVILFTEKDIVYETY